MAKEKPGVMMYWETFDVLEALLDGQAKTMLHAIRHYSQYGEVPDFGDDTILATLWMLFQPKLDADNERYERIREARIEAGRKGGIQSGKSRQQNEANALEMKQNEANEANASKCKQTKPTTTSTTASTTESASTATPDPDSNSNSDSASTSNPETNPVYEGRRDCAGAPSAPVRTDLLSVASDMTPEQEAENERLREEAMDKLRGWQG
ncbi:MAG: DUF6291 domain-containing protein [Oscillospiraceae bacterium]|jgi:hypothetical protein